MTGPDAAAFTKLWAELSRESADANYFRARRIAAVGGVETYAALRNSDGAAALVFRLATAISPNARFRFSTDGMAFVRVAEEGDSNHLLAGVVEERAQPGDLFAVLAADIARHVGGGSSAGAGARLAERLLQWQSALRARRDGLTRDALVGLFGELVVLAALGERMPSERAVEAWKGPEDGAQDFASEGIAIEVKTTAGSHAHVPISSLDQLDGRSLRRLALLVVKIVEDPEGESLVTLVGRVRSVLGCGALEGKLALGGWRDQDANRYEELRFRRIGIDAYEVREGFPALTRAIAPMGVADAAYRIDARALSPFTLGPGAIADLAEEMTGMAHGS